MPRNVRNFWIDAEIAGRETSLAGGPQAKDGWIDVTIKQRDNGGIITAVEILGRAKPDGTLRLMIRSGGREIACVETAR